MEDYKNSLKSDEQNSTIIFDNEIYLSLDRTGFESEKVRTKFIKNVEALIRRSMEYREFVGFVKYTMGQRYCVFTLEDDEETNDIELHHHPLTLYDIVDCITLKYENEGKSFNSFKIASEVIDLHFKLKVGFLPILRSLHKKFHKGFLKIPIEFVLGDYKYIINTYPVPDDVLKKVEYYENIKLKDLKNYWYPGLKMDQYVDENDVESSTEKIEKLDDINNKM